VKTSDEVALDMDRVRWGRLPASIRVAIVNGVAIIAEERERLRASVLVSTLPPVRVVPEIWTNPEWTGCVDGRSTIMKLGRRHVFGVELPAPVALSGSRDAIRAVMIHEFGHCYHHAAAVVDHMDAGRTDPLNLLSTANVYTDEAADRAALVDPPSDWFAEGVALDFPYWNDPRIRIAPREEWFRALPVELGVRQISGTSIDLTDDIIDHVRRLRERRKT